MRISLCVRWAQTTVSISTVCFGALRPSPAHRTSEEQQALRSALHAARERQDTTCQIGANCKFAQHMHVHAFCNGLARMRHLHVRDGTRRLRWRCCPLICMAVRTRRVWRAGCALLYLSACDGLSVHGKVRSLSPLSLGALDLSIERPPFQARVAYGLMLAATPWVWPLARHLI